MQVRTPENELTTDLINYA